MLWAKNLLGYEKRNMCTIAHGYCLRLILYTWYGTGQGSNTMQKAQKEASDSR